MNKNTTIRQDKYEEYLRSLNISEEPPQVSSLFDIEMKEIFKACDDFTYREIVLSRGEKGIIYFLQGIVDLEFLHMSVIKPLVESMKDQFEEVDHRQQINNPKNISLKNWNEIIFALFNGGAICHIDGQLPIEVKVPGKEKRNISEPTTQYQVFGPKIGFIEDIQTNISIVRKFLKDPRVKTVNYEIGSLSHTKVSVMYIDGYADKKDIEQIDKRMQNVKIDQLITLGQLNKQIIDHPTSIFPQVFGTERPDNVALALGEGKIAIFIDNVTFVSILPVTLFDLYLVGDDLSFSSFYNALFVRAIRYLCMILSTALPALYVALVAFHPELIPETLALTIAESRSQIPFPAAAEALIMMIALDVLVEASIRLPSFVGQTIGIVGGLVIGTAAVEAGVVSSLMVIVISFTAIASFTSPTWELVSSLRVLRYGLLIISSIFGLYGFVLGFCVIFIHICNLESLSTPYISPLSTFKMQQLLGRMQQIKTQYFEKKGG
ncbi:spore germination protein [Anaerobacillus alkaliphilus]|uniref:Spore germination protein n=1 Tax=Anaerobacillus alkaliphilus TaxID=1548597 RepID=A0A4Q0VUC2_9BACI|nr:spore germination protein [Anaerobacillus alkaliphilus]RXJ01942.1 spore germination protein [Anaerobacillus alkaliphilus]